MHADVLVLHHHSTGLGERLGHEELLIEVGGGRQEAAAQVSLVAIAGDGEALHGTDVEAGVALDAQGRREGRLDVTVETALDFASGLFCAEAELHFEIERLEAFSQLDVAHLLARRLVVVVVIAPLAHAHLLADEVHAHGRAIVEVDVLTEVVDGDGGRVAVGHRPDDVLGTPRGVAPEEDARHTGLHRHLIDGGHIPLAKGHAEVALDPGERVFLTDGQDDVVTGNDHRVERGRVAGSLIPLQDVEFHAHEATLFDHEARGRVVDQNLHAFFFGVVEFPGGGLEELPGTSGHDLDVTSPEPARRATTVHGRVAHADDEDALANLADVAEGDRLQPVDADEYVRLELVVATRQVQLFSARSADAHEDGVELIVQQRLQTGHRGVVADVHPHVENHAGLFFQHLFGETKRRDVRAHQAAWLVELLEDRHLVAQRHQIVRDRERGGPRSDAGNSLAVLLVRNLG